MRGLDLAVGLELSQAEAVSRAFMADALLRDRLVNLVACGSCGGDVDAERLAVSPGATRCSFCAGVPTLARRR